MTTATRFGLSALAAALLFACAISSPAQAASAIETAGPKGAEASTAIRTVASVTEAEDESATCSRSRKRLWIEGEGWIVRRVTTCR